MRREETGISDNNKSDRKQGADAPGKRKSTAGPARKKQGGRSSSAHKTEKGRALKDQREVVLLALLSHEKKDTFSNVLVRQTLDDCAGMSAVEKAFIKRLLEGVIERKTELDARIEHFTGRPVTRLHPAVHQILRMGIYQIYYMDSVPDSAVCNEAVRLAKRHGPARLSGFVNGVLRNAAREAAHGKREDHTLFLNKSIADADGSVQTSAGRVKAMSLQHSMPEWLVQMWTDQLGEEETEKLLEALMEIRPVSIRLSPRLCRKEKENLLAQLSLAGVVIEDGRWLPDCRHLRKTSDLRRLPGFSEGLWTVQDESSMLAVKAAGLTGGETVFDVCAAPGGKSFFAAESLLAMKKEARRDRWEGTERKDIEDGEDGTVYSFDLSKRKTDMIRADAKRLGLDNIRIAERDARNFFAEDEGKADVVVCDLPCSGLGVIGKKRDIKYRASREGLESLQQLQRQILTNAVRYLKRGGVLIYSTCTINRAENEENALWIEKELGLKPEDLTAYLPDGFPGIRNNMVQLLPHIHGTDGFFISRFRNE